MKKAVTAGFLVMLLLLLVARQNEWDVRSRVKAWFAPPVEEKPEDAVYRMLDAARAGDAQRYLACFSGPMRAEIGQVEKESSQERFRQYLQKQSKLFTGVAVSVLDRTPDEKRAHIRLEYVFPERNEIQDMYLERESNSWQVVKVMGSEQITTLIPYGTAVTD